VCIAVRVVELDFIRRCHLAILTGLHNKWLAAFRPPWTANEIAGGYVVRDANKQALAYVYCRESEHAASVAKVLTKDEARRIASNIAKLPRRLHLYPGAA
jgi:hypothetical protein